MSNKYFLLYGFNKNDNNEVGYLRVVDKTNSSTEPYFITNDESCATRFSITKKKWTPERICKFFNLEEELKDWKFHVVFRSN